MQWLGIAQPAPGFALITVSRKRLSQISDRAVATPSDPSSDSAGAQPPLPARGCAPNSSHSTADMRRSPLPLRGAALLQSWRSVKHQSPTNPHQSRMNPASIPVNPPSMVGNDGWLMVADGGLMRGIDEGWWWLCGCVWLPSYGGRWRSPRVRFGLSGQPLSLTASVIGGIL